MKNPSKLTKNHDMGFCFNFPCFLSPFVSPIVPLNSSLIPYQPPIIFFVHFSPVLNIPPRSPWSPIFPWPHTTNLSTDFTPPVPNLPPVLPSFRLPLPFLSSLSPPPLPHRLSLPCLLGIAFKTVGSVAYSNLTNTETTSAHKISVSFSISVLHDKASMGLLKQHFR